MAFLLDAVTFLISAALLATIPLPAPEREDEEEGFLPELRAGFGYLAGSRVPLAIVADAFLATLTVTAAIPAEAFLARETFDAGDLGYGLLASLWGGMILGFALTAVLGGRTNLLLYLASIFAMALALAGVGLSPAFRRARRQGRAQNRRGPRYSRFLGDAPGGAVIVGGGEFGAEVERELGLISSAAGPALEAAKDPRAGVTPSRACRNVPRSTVFCSGRSPKAGRSRSSPSSWPPSTGPKASRRAASPSGG